MLSAATVRTAKPTARPYRLGDFYGLYMEVQPSGAKYWRLKYRLHGKERRYAIGVYPAVTLERARKLRDEARVLVAAGTDPCDSRRVRVREHKLAALSSFEAVGLEWYEKHSVNWAPTNKDKIILRLRNDVFPWLGSRPITSIEAPDILEVLRRVEGRGAVDTAHRELQYISRIFRYAIATGRARRDPAADLRGGALTPVNRSRHYATLLAPAAIGGLLRAIEGYAGSLATRCALRLAPLTFVRPGELRAAEWLEFDLEAAEWRIPAARMKARMQHIVPLSCQALAVLRELQPLTGGGRYLFPSIRSLQRPMSNNTVNAALRRLGYEKADITGHGFRAMASTLLNEQGWHRDAIERQLAHVEGNKVRAAYNHAEHLAERRKMMQAWADHMDRLALGATVTRLPTAA